MTCLLWMNKPFSPFVRMVFSTLKHVRFMAKIPFQQQCERVELSLTRIERRLLSQQLLRNDGIEPTLKLKRIRGLLLDVMQLSGPHRSSYDRERALSIFGRTVKLLPYLGRVLPPSLHTSMFSSIRRLQDWKALDRIMSLWKQYNHKGNIIEYTALLEVMAAKNDFSKANTLFYEEVLPLLEEKVGQSEEDILQATPAWAAYIHCCTTAGEIEEATIIYEKMKLLQYPIQPMVYEHLIHGACQLGSYPLAWDFFNALFRDGIHPSAGSITPYVQHLLHNDPHQAKVVLDILREKKVSYDRALYILHLKVLDALHLPLAPLYGEIDGKGMVDKRVLTVFLTCMKDRESKKEAMKVYHRWRRNGGKPDAILLSVLSQIVLQQYPDKKGLKEVVEECLEMLDNNYIYHASGDAFNPVISLLARNGECGRAEEILGRMLVKDIPPTDGSFSPLVAAYAEEGDHDAVVRVWSNISGYTVIPSPAILATVANSYLRTDTNPLPITAVQSLQRVVDALALSNPDPFPIHIYQSMGEIWRRVADAVSASAAMDRMRTDLERRGLDLSTAPSLL